MKFINKNKLNYIMLISIYTNNINLILIYSYLILLNYYINLLILLITFLIFRVILRYNNFINNNIS
jgi:hypothetical protein